MGDMADYYRDQELMYGSNMWPDPDSLVDEPRVTRASKWKTCDGQEIVIRDMALEHLQNIMKMYKDHRLILPDAWVIALEREVKRREKG